MIHEFQKERDLSKGNNTLIIQNEADRPLFFVGTIGVMGVGHTLTRADKVVIFEPQYNPSTEDQAAKRAVRIEQTKEVSVYRFTCAGENGVEIEKKILQKAELRAYFTEAAFDSNFSTTSTSFKCPEP